MDYRIAYEQIICALFKYDKALGDAHTSLMLEVRHIENNLGKTLPPIKLADTPNPTDD